MFVQLTVIVLAGLAGPLLGHVRRWLVPVVAGELIAGAILGRTGFGVIDSQAQPLPAFGAIGFAMLMLSAGTRVDISSTAIRLGFVRGLIAFVCVAVAAVPLAILIDRLVNLGHPALLAVLIAGSSGAIVFPILAEHQLRGGRVAFLTAWIAVADAVTVVLMPLTLAAQANLGSQITGDVAIIAAGVIVLLAMNRARKYRPSQQLLQQSRDRGWAFQVRLSMLLLLGLSAIAERTGGSTLIAGFLAGMILVRLREPNRLAVQLTGLANGFFVPVFFVLLGARMDLRALVTAPSSVVLAVALAAAAVVAHLVAARIAGTGSVLGAGLASSAQLGLPAAAASLALASGAMRSAAAAALVAAGCLTLIPATIGTRLLVTPREATRPRADSA